MESGEPPTDESQLFVILLSPAAMDAKLGGYYSQVRAVLPMITIS